jgi:hypothetical protein
MSVNKNGNTKLAAAVAGYDFHERIRNRQLNPRVFVPTEGFGIGSKKKRLAFPFWCIVNEPAVKSLGPISVVQSKRRAGSYGNSDK